MLYSHCCIIYVCILYIRSAVFTLSVLSLSPRPLPGRLSGFWVRFLPVKTEVFPCHGAYLGVQALGFWLCKAPRDNCIVKSVIRINWIKLIWIKLWGFFSQRRGNVVPRQVLGKVYTQELSAARWVSSLLKSTMISVVISTFRWRLMSSRHLARQLISVL